MSTPSDHDDETQWAAARYPGGPSSPAGSTAGSTDESWRTAGAGSTAGLTPAPERSPSLPTVLAGCLVLVLAAGAAAVRLSGTLPVHSSPTVVILVVGVALLATGAILALAGRRATPDAPPRRVRDPNENTDE